MKWLSNQRVEYLRGELELDVNKAENHVET